jgi:S-(hydroxymethyl)glutathione dehydrogenase/alcohol dehydrogenase
MGDAPFQIFVPQLARYYLDGRLMLDELVSCEIPLAAVNAGFDNMVSGVGARNVLTF